MMKHVNFRERKKAVQIVSKRSAVIVQKCRILLRLGASGNFETVLDIFSFYTRYNALTEKYKHMAFDGYYF